MKKRAYKQNCALALASDLLGERWTLLLLRELLIQPCRYKDLNQWLEGMGTNLLASRLQELEDEGLIEKQEPEHKRSAYQLTAMGRAAEPMVLAMIRWGYQFGETQEGYCHHDHWDLLAMKAFYQPCKSESGNTATILQFTSEKLTAWVSVSEKGYEFDFGEKGEAEVVDDRLECTIQEFHKNVLAGVFTDNQQVQNFLAWFDIPD